MKDSVYYTVLFRRACTCSTMDSSNTTNQIQVLLYLKNSIII